MASRHEPWNRWYEEVFESLYRYHDTRGYPVLLAEVMLNFVGQFTYSQMCPALRKSSTC